MKMNRGQMSWRLDANKRGELLALRNAHDREEPPAKDLLQRTSQGQNRSSRCLPVSRADLVEGIKDRPETISAELLQSVGPRG